MIRWLKLAMLLACAWAWSAFPQAYPSKPIRLIFPWPSGGGDVLPRAMAQPLGAALGQPVVIENRPGAAGTIGTAFVAKSEADGYTLVMTDMASHAISASLYKSLTYDALRDFAPVALPARLPLALAVNPSLNARTLPEFIALAKGKPGVLNYASSGNGAITHLAMERFTRVAGIQLVHVPYKGSAPAIAAVLAGDTAAAFATLPSVLGPARGGKLTVLGVSFAKPVAQFPEAPAISDHVAGFQLGLYQGILAPAATPRAVIERLHAAADKALDDPGVQTAMQRAAYEPIRMSPEQFREYLEIEVRVWGELVRGLRLTID